MIIREIRECSIQREECIVVRVVRKYSIKRVRKCDDNKEERL